MDDEERDRFAAYAADHGPGLLRLAYLLCGDRHRAEDVTQSALASVFTAWKRVEQADDPDAYVRRVLVNVVRRTHRRRRVVEEPLALSNNFVTPGDPLAIQDQRALLVAALRELPPKQREVVVLRYVLDLPEAVVADVLRVSPGTVKSQAAKGLAKLRAMPALLEEVGR